MDGLVNEGMSEWVDEWMDVQIDEWIRTISSKSSSMLGNI